MRKLIGNLKPYWYLVVLLTAMLCVQAFADLALPEYTQNIIDVGIQNKGIEHITPEKMTAKEYNNAMIFMEAKEKSQWESLYTKEGKYYIRKDVSQEKLDQADEDLLTPIVLTYQLGHTSVSQFKKTIQTAMEQNPQTKPFASKVKDMSVSEIGKQIGMEVKTFQAKDSEGNEKTYVDMRPMMKSMIDQGVMTDEAISKAKEQMNKTIDKVGSRTLKAMGIAYAAESAANAGIDVDSLQKSYLWSSGGKMLLMAFLMFVAAAIAAFIAAKIGANVARDLREKQFRKVMTFSDAEMRQFSTASLITRSTNDVQQVQNVSTMMLRMALYSPILGIWGIVKVAQTGAHMGYVVALAVLLIIAFVGVLMAVTLPKFRIMQQLVDGVNQVAREILTGLGVIRAFTREEEEEKRFDVANQELKKTQLFTNRVMSLMQPTMQLVMFGLVVIITWIAAHRIDDGNLQVGAMTAFITYSMLIVMSFLILTVMSILIPRAGVAAERIDEVLRTESSILETEKPQEITDAKGVVRFEHVDFCYPDAEESIIVDIDFEAKAGETTAIIGSTGSGKSTLANLIPRFYDVTKGRITLDGVDVRELAIGDLRKRIGFVPQKGVLFSGTIESNLRFGATDASQEDIQEAVEISQSEEFIADKEQGIESDIAQGGSNVSGGQKQRLAIARAIAKKPEVLVFDDSFSALDMKTDAKLRKELEERQGHVTQIIVAQRVSTILHADQILVMDDGRIVGKGTHSELMKTCEVYQEIAKSQLSSMELEGIG